MYYLLLYDLADQFAERRTPYRDAHFKLARAAAWSGVPADLSLNASSAAAASEFLSSRTSTARIAELDARIARYRASLDAGGDPAV